MPEKKKLPVPLLHQIAGYIADEGSGGTSRMADDMSRIPLFIRECIVVLEEVLGKTRRTSLLMDNGGAFSLPIASTDPAMYRFMLVLDNYGIHFDQYVVLDADTVTSCKTRTSIPYGIGFCNQVPSLSRAVLWILMKILLTYKIQESEFKTLNARFLRHLSPILRQRTTTVPASSSPPPPPPPPSYAQTRYRQYLRAKKLPVIRTQDFKMLEPSSAAEIARCASIQLIDFLHVIRNNAFLKKRPDSQKIAIPIPQLL